MPEAIRQACYMPTIDHRSPLFGKILHPVLDGVRRVLKSETAKIFVFPSTGTGGWKPPVQLPECGRQSSGRATVFFHTAGSICANATGWMFISLKPHGVTDCLPLNMRPS
jgi:hypothetical protein